jgi:ubiquinone/menaquinone biosynthesis C-methylase UbiE
MSTNATTVQAALSVQSAYDEWSKTYDQDANATKELDARVTREALSQLPARDVIELGCGTGKNTAFLADQFERVTALDFSAGMLARARERVPAANVTFVEADLKERLPVADATADLATINLVLEHIADLRPVFQEAARALRPGGHLFVSELHPIRQYLGSQARFERDGVTTRIDAHIHHVSEFLDAARDAGLELVELREWWQDDYGPQIPRLLALLFRVPKDRTLN